MHRVERTRLGLALRDGQLPGPKLIGTLSAGDPYPDGQPDCVPPGGDSRLSGCESRLVTRPADEFRVVRRSTEPTVFVESALARSM
jgi:hypothetical protein